MSPMSLPVTKNAHNADLLAPLPEAVWLRLVSQLDWVSACALSTSSEDAKTETMAARGALADTIKERTLELRRAEEKSKAEEQVLSGRLERQRNLLAEALAHLEPLRTRRLRLGNNEPLHEGMRQVFTELEENQPRVLAEQAAAAATTRRKHLESLRGALSVRETQARERIAEGELQPVR